MHGNMNVKFGLLISLSIYHTLVDGVVKLKVKCGPQVPELCRTLLQIIRGTTLMEI